MSANYQQKTAFIHSTLFNPMQFHYQEQPARLRPTLTDHHRQGKGPHLQADQTCLFPASMNYIQTLKSSLVNYLCTVLSQFNYPEDLNELHEAPCMCPHSEAILSLLTKANCLMESKHATALTSRKKEMFLEWFSEGTL